MRQSRTDAKTIVQKSENMSLHLKPLPSLSDNYIWLIINDEDSTAVIIDPGSSEPCTAYFDHEGINPTAILVTHRHWDHVNGIEKLVDDYKIPVYGPSTEQSLPDNCTGYK